MRRLELDEDDDRRRRDRTGSRRRDTDTLSFYPFSPLSKPNRTMSDSDGAWDDDDFEVPDLTANKGADAANVVDDKFADEDAEEEKPVVVKTKKPAVAKKKMEIKTSVDYDDGALDDPIAEKLRRQKLVEEADLRAAKELFGGGDEDIALDGFEPKSKSEYEKLGSAISYKYLTSRSESAFYTAGLKALLRVALRDLCAADVKDVEQAIVTIRSDKVKKEKAEAEAAKKAAAGSKKGKGKFLNAGGKGGDSGLDDFKYDLESVDDAYDFM